MERQISEEVKRKARETQNCEVAKLDLCALCLQGHWKDNEESRDHSIWVIVGHGVEEITSAAGTLSEEESMACYDAIASAFGMRDNDISYYVNEYDANDICGGDFIPDDILEERSSKCSIILTRVLVSYVKEKQLCVITDEKIDTQNPVETLGDYCEDEFTVQCYSVLDGKWHSLETLNEYRDAKDYVDELSRIVLGKVED